MAGTPIALSQHFPPALVMFPPSSPGEPAPCLRHRVRHGLGASWAHSLLALVLQECRTALKRRGSCSSGTFTIFPAIYRISGKHIIKSGKRLG